MKYTVTVLAFLVLLGGCKGNLALTQIDASENETYIGAPYFLGKQQFEITLTRQILACPDDWPHDEGLGDFKFRFSAEVTNAVVADPGASYTMNYAELFGATKTGTFDVEYYDDGRLKSVNSDAKDQTGTIIKNTVATVGSIALAAAGVPPIPVTAALADELVEGVDRPVSTPCRPETELAIKALNDSKSALAAQKRVVEMAQLTYKDAVLRLGLIDEPTDDQKDAVTAAYDAFQAATSDLEVLVLYRAPFVALTSIQNKVAWSPVQCTRNEAVNKCVATDAAYVLSHTQLGKWFEDGAEAKRRLGQFLAITREVRIDGATNPVTFTTDELEKGIVAQVPVRGTLVLASRTALGDKKVFTNKAAMFPQFGPNIILPFENGAFEDNSLSVTFSQSGSIEKLTYGEKTAALAEASGSLADSVAQISGILSQIDNKKVTQQQQELTELELEKKLNDARAALVSPEPDTVVEETADLSAQATLLRAKIELLKLEEEHKKLLAGQ